jgi:hypothetical protein
LVLGLTLSGLAGLARAQSSDAGPAPDSEAHTTAARDPNADGTAQAGAAPEAAQPAANSGGFPKTLSPQQRLPENLQGWLRERNRRSPAAERPPAPLPHLAESRAEEQQAVEGYKRRLRSFDEGGVTVLSNRHAAPPPPEPVAATAAIAVAATVPAPRVEEDPEPEVPSVTETRSLRARQKMKAPLSDHELGWPAFAVPVAAVGLGLIWLRRRRQAGQDRRTDH